MSLGSGEEGGFFNGHFFAKKWPGYTERLLYNIMMGHFFCKDQIFLYKSLSSSKNNFLYKE
jgi:hypothetical protein